MTLRTQILLLALVAAAAGCKPEHPEMTEYRVSLVEALRTEAPGGLEPEQEALPVATLRREVITLGELVGAIRVLPPFARYYYSSVDKAQLFLQNYIVMNLCAREAITAGMDFDPQVRMDLLAAMEKQIRADYLADRVRTDAGTTDELEQRRKALWRKRVDALSADAEISIDAERVSALAEQLRE